MRHVLDFVGLAGGQIRVTCREPGCVDEQTGRQWARTYEPHHTAADWAELDRMHSEPITDTPAPRRRRRHAVAQRQP